MIRHHRLDLYDVDLWLVTRPRDLTEVLTSIQVEPDERTEWASVGQVQTYWRGELGKEPPQHHLVICIDVPALKKDRDRERLLKVVVHEATHAGAMVLDYINEGYDGESEPLAYLVGWITTWLWREVRPCGTR